jgi:hypothetical protein
MLHTTIRFPLQKEDMSYYFLHYQLSSPPLVPLINISSTYRSASSLSKRPSPDSVEILHATAALTAFGIAFEDLRIDGSMRQLADGIEQASCLPGDIDVPSSIVNPFFDHLCVLLHQVLNV